MRPQITAHRHCRVELVLRTRVIAHHTMTRRCRCLWVIMLNCPVAGSVLCHRMMSNALLPQAGATVLITYHRQKTVQGQHMLPPVCRCAIIWHIYHWMPSPIIFHRTITFGTATANMLHLHRPHFTESYRCRLAISGGMLRCRQGLRKFNLCNRNDVVPSKMKCVMLWSQCTSGTENELIGDIAYKHLVRFLWLWFMHISARFNLVLSVSELCLTVVKLRSCVKHANGIRFCYCCFIYIWHRVRVTIVGFLHVVKSCLWFSCVWNRMSIVKCHEKGAEIDLRDPKVQSQW